MATSPFNANLRISLPPQPQSSTAFQTQLQQAHQLAAQQAQQRAHRQAQQQHAQMQTNLNLANNLNRLNANFVVTSPVTRRRSQSDTFERRNFSRHRSSIVCVPLFSGYPVFPALPRHSVRIGFCGAFEHRLFGLVLPQMALFLQKKRPHPFSPRPTHPRTTAMLGLKKKMLSI